MTISFHFELDPDKPDEGKALQLLEAWQQAGWDLPKVMVMALLSLDHEQASRFDVGSGAKDTAPLLAELRETLLDVRDGSLSALKETHQVLYQTQALLEQLQHLNLAAPSSPDTHKDPPQEGVSDSFLASLKKAIKPGITLDD